MNYPGPARFKHVVAAGQGSVDPERTRLLETRVAARRRLEIIIYRRSRRSSAPRSCPARSTTRAPRSRLWRKAKEMPGVTAAVFNQSVIQPSARTCRRQGARPIRVCGGDPSGHGPSRPGRRREGDRRRCRSRFVYPFHEMSTPRATSRRSSATRRHQARGAEAKRLMKEAAPERLRNLDFVVRDIASFKLWASRSRDAEREPEHRV